MIETSVVLTEANAKKDKLHILYIFAMSQGLQFVLKR